MHPLLPPLGAVLPELVLALAAIVLLLVGAIRGERSANLVTGLAIAVLAAVFILVLLKPAVPVVAFNGALVIDPFSRFMKALALLGATVSLIMSVDWLNREQQNKFEYAVLVLIATLGMMMLVSAGDLIALYLGLELMSLSLYVIAAINRDSVRSTEAGLKYFVLGALSSGMLLYGASLIYGFAGSTKFDDIAVAVQAGAGTGVLFSMARDGQMEMQARLSEFDLARLSVGSSAEVIPVGSERTFSGEIWQLSPTIDQNSREGIARIALPYDKALRPGGFASAKLRSGTVTAPLLPESAILSDEKGSFVYVVGSDDKVERRAVKTGEVNARGIAVIEGLSGKERIVLRAGGFLNAGDKVQPVVAK
ncbi:MAG: hypothetical protein B7X92_16130 [Novosphingobium sp. 17-62-9]|nr:MAG: hypothetical protein B7X92_16130 [Novosphingobium sp. 17-62-9]